MKRFGSADILCAWCVALASATSLRASDDPVPPPNVIFTPSPHAYSLAKHPTLPVLYVGCSAAPESKNLITIRLDADGKPAADGRRDWPDWFTTDPKNPHFMYTLQRPVVWGEKHVLYLTAAPGYPDKYFAVTNHNEIAAISLDTEGLPTRLMQSLRTPPTSSGGRDSPMGLVCDPATRRLYVNCYSQLGWCALDEQGVPIPDRFQVIPGIANFWDWVHVSDWRRCFGMPGGMNVTICQLGAEGRNAVMCHTIAAENRDYIGGHVPRHNIEVSTRFHKLYMLRFHPRQQLIIGSLTNEGRLTGTPRYFELGLARAIRCDFKAGLLHAISREWVKTFRLDVQGYPTGAPIVASINCGDPRDILVDETTGTVYVASSQPPGTKD